MWEFALAELGVQLECSTAASNASETAAIEAAASKAGRAQPAISSTTDCRCAARRASSAAITAACPEKPACIERMCVAAPTAICRLPLNCVYATPKAFSVWSGSRPISLAAIVGGIANFHKLPHTLTEVNNALYNAVFRAALDEGVERFTYVSSSMVFERATQYPTTEEHVWETPMPRSAYGFSKMAGEVWCRAAHDEHGLPYTICRPFNAYGPGEMPEDEPGIAHAVPDLIRKSLQRLHPLPIFGTGEHTRAYTFEQTRWWGQLEWARPALDMVFDGVADTIFADPPFNLGKRYGGEWFLRKARGGEKTAEHDEGVLGGCVEAVEAVDQANECHDRSRHSGALPSSTRRKCYASAW